MMLLCLLDAPAIGKQNSSKIAIDLSAEGHEQNHTACQGFDDHDDVARPSGRRTAKKWAQLSHRPERTTCNGLGKCTFLRGHCWVGALVFMTPPSVGLNDAASIMSNP